jgi:alkanesulfonate monooxygenase SsuD/methylene tetrahydromethanopterin reductase-like flavin-dependent oxidoreductase (luciferase family)
VQDLTLVPKPIAPIEIWQAVTSPPTLDYCARVRHSAVIPGRGIAGTRTWWDDFGTKAAEGGWDIGRSGARCLAIPMHVGRTSQAARDGARDAHDEWIKFLSPYGRFRAYRRPDGGPVPFDFQPTLEDSIEQDQMVIGSPEECADVLGRYRDEVGVEHVVLFFDMPGLTQDAMDEQLELTANDVLPKLGVTLDGPAAPPTRWAFE